MIPPGLAAISRRTWLSRAVVAGVASHTQVASAAQPDILLGGGRYQEQRDGRYHFTLSRVEPASGKVRLVPVPFFPHGLSLDPRNRQRVFAFEKIGPGAGVVDLDSMTWQGAIAPVPGRRFYGHGACSPDGEFLYSTETDAAGQGAIGIRLADSLRYVGDFPSFGANPHDCALIENGQVMLVTNGGGAHASADTPSLCFIDVRSRKLLARAEMPDPRFNTGHLVALPDRAAVVVSAPRLGWGVEHLGAISHYRSGGVLVPVVAPEAVVHVLKGEALSVLALPVHDLLLVTHPTPGLLSCWRLGSGEHLKSLVLPHVRGVVPSVDGQQLWLSHGANASLLRLPLDSLEPGLATGIDNTLLAGSHLFNHALMP
ncbi:MAG: hypothetical protein RLZZ401_58 [Pseudomonadota bacterium]